MSHTTLLLLLLTMGGVVQSSFGDLVINLNINIQMQKWIDQTCDLNILPSTTPNTCCVNCTCGGKECHTFGPWCTDGNQDGIVSAEEITPLTSGYLTCTSQQLKQYNTTASYPNTIADVFVVRRCPVVPCNEELYDLGESIDKCDNSERYLDDIDSIIPVVDARTGIPYKSKFCAACHGVPGSNMTQWTARVMCNGEFYWPTSSDKIITDVYNSRTCNIIYDVPLGVTLNCRVTGIKECDEDVGFACYSKPSTLTTMCLLKHSKSQPALCLDTKKIGTNLMLPFSLLLGSRMDSDTGSQALPSLRQLGTSEQLNMTIGESGSFFDHFKNVVRNLTCLPPKELRGGACYTASRDITGASFNFSMKMLPVNDMPAEEAKLMSRCIPFKIREWMYTISQNWIVLVSCYMNLANTMKDREPDIQVEYFVVEIDAIVTDVALDIQVIDKVLELNGTTNASLNACGHEFRMEIIRRDRLIRLDVDVLYNDVDNNMLYKLNDYAKVLIPDASSVSTSMVLEPSLRCPLVSLDISEYTIELFAWGVTIAELNASISRWFIKEAYSSDEILSIQICFDTYRNLVEQSFASGDIEITEVHYSIAIGVVSFVCIGLSTVCLLLTLLTYCIFKDMRNQPGVNNMALCVSLICGQLLLQFGIGQKNVISDWACNTIGILIHFFWLNTVAWMNICCLHCYRVFRNMTEKQNNNFSLKTTSKYIAYSTLFAIVPVIANITSNMLKDEPDIGYGKMFCYISEKRSVFMTFALPLIVLLLINIALFIAIVVKIKRLPAVKISSSREHKYSSVYARLSSLTGCLWIFGYIYMATGEPVLEYLFVIFNASQGVFIFITFVCNKNCFRKWRRLTSGNTVSIETKSTQVTSSQTK